MKQSLSPEDLSILNIDEIVNSINSIYSHDINSVHSIFDCGLELFSG